MISTSVSDPVVDNPDDGEIAGEFFASRSLTSSRGADADHPIARYTSYRIYRYLACTIGLLFDDEKRTVPKFLYTVR